MDINICQGRVLLREGWSDEATLARLYPQACAGPADLCELLLREGRLPAAEAPRLRAIAEAERRRAVLESGVHESEDLLVTLRSSSGDSLAPRPSSSRLAPIGSAAEGPSRIGDYEVIREISRGGFGIVFVARSLRLKTEVALKVMLRGELADSEELQRFRTEAETAARLTHPNIVRILDVGEDQGQHYLVMELIEGRSLKARIAEDGPLPEEQAASLTLKLARALSAAHERAILHRDIKPANVLIREADGEPLLTDFGLAKDAAVAEGLTVSGQVIGTPEYMSPEQADGDLSRVDRRADIYSLGATLYEMLTGRAPFVGSSSTNVIRKLLIEEPDPPRSLRPELSKDLETICLTCLEKDIPRRYVTADALAGDLERYLKDEPILARPPSAAERLRRWRARNRSKLLAAATVALAAALVLATSLGWLAQQREREARLIALDVRLREEVPQVLAAAASGYARELAARCESGVEAEALLAELGSRDALTEALRGAWAERWARERALHPRLGEAPPLTAEALDGAAALVPWGARRAQLLLGESRAAQDPSRAAALRAQAYSADPNGGHGLEALADTIDALVAEERTVEASLLSERLIREDVGPALQARALDQRFRLQLASGESERGAATLAKLDALAAESAAAAAAAPPRRRAWLRAALSIGLRPRIEELPKDTVLACAGVPGGAPILARVNPEDGRALTIETWLGEARRAEVVRSPLTLAAPATAAVCGAVKDGERILGVISDGPRVEAGHGPYTITALAWDGQRARLLGSCDIRSSEFRLINLSRDGDEVLALLNCAYSGNPGQVRTSLLLRFNAREVISETKLPPASGSFIYDTEFLDLDGDGEDELIVGMGAWKHWRIVAMELDGERIAESERLGHPMAITPVRREDGRWELLATVQRRIAEDVRTVFGEDLSPQLPDAVWLLELTEGRLTGRIRSKLPFERRSEFSFYQTARGDEALPGFEGSIISEAVLRGRTTLVLTPPEGAEGLEDLRVRVAYRMSESGLPPVPFDLDGDGDAELIAFEVPPTRALAFGLAPSGAAGRVEGEDVLHAGAPADALTAALSLLTAGRGEACIAAVEALLSEARLGPTMRREALQLRARAESLNGDFVAARGSAHAAWKAEPQQGMDALCAEASYAEQAGDLRGALDALDLASTLYLLPPARARALGAERRRLQSLLALEPQLKLLDLILSPELPLGVTDPWLFELTPAGLRCRVSRGRTPHLRVPLVYEGGSLALRARLLPKSMGFGVRVGVALRSGEETLRLEALMRGGGDLRSYERNIRGSVRAFASKSVFLPLPAFHGDERLDARLQYSHISQDLSLTLARGAERAAATGESPIALPAGTADLLIGKHDISYDETGIALVSIASFSNITVEARANGIAIGSMERLSALERAGGAWLRGQFDAASELAQVHLRGLAGDADRLPTELLIALADLRRGRREDGQARLRALSASHPIALRELLAPALPGFDDELARDIAVALGAAPAPGAQGLARVVDELLAAIQGGRGGDLTAASGWYQLGGFERCLACCANAVAAPREDRSPNTQVAREMTGYALGELGRYAEAVEAFDAMGSLEDLAPQTRERVRARKSFCAYAAQTKAPALSPENP